LTINAAKSNAIIASHTKTKYFLNLSIHCNSIPVTIQAHVKYLSVIIDNKLNFLRTHPSNREKLPVV